MVIIGTMGALGSEIVVNLWSHSVSHVNQIKLNHIFSPPSHLWTGELSVGGQLPRGPKWLHMLLLDTRKIWWDNLEHHWQCFLFTFFVLLNYFPSISHRNLLLSSKTNSFEYLAAGTASRCTKRQNVSYQDDWNRLLSHADFPKTKILISTG